MPLTRSFRETVQARARRDIKFRQALLAEAMQALLDGNVEEGRAALRSCINATIGFEKLGEAMGRITQEPDAHVRALAIPRLTICLVSSASCKQEDGRPSAGARRGRRATRRGDAADGRPRRHVSANFCSAGRSARRRNRDTAAASDATSRLPRSRISARGTSFRDWPHAASVNGRARSIRLRSRGECIASPRSVRRCTLSQKSALLPNTRARMRAVAAVTLRRSLHSSLTCLRCTPMASASAPCVRPTGP